MCNEWRTDPAAFVAFALSNGWKPGLEIDRINGDGDYEPENVRFVTKEINRRNRGKQKTASGKNPSSQFVGVTWRKDQSKWMAQIQVGDKRIFLGNHASEIDAAHAYDAEAEKHEGFRLNLPKE